MGAARGYDLYGSIAVIDADTASAKAMAMRLIAENKNIRTVLRKGGAVSGRYRTRKLIYVSGERNYVANYRENGCAFRFDIRKTFFSTRLAYERRRITDLVKDGEKVIVMFAGVGPYAIEIARVHKKCKVIAIELNRSAFIYMKENIKLNKAQNVVPELGDAARFTSKYKNFADRIIMPLPKSASRFLPAALKMAKKRCTIHYYAFCPSDGAEEMSAGVRSFFAKKGRRTRLLGWRVARPYSATESEMVLDVQSY